IRVFPIFEGANDVMRSFIALGGLKALGAELEDLTHLKLTVVVGTIGTLADYALGRVGRALRPDHITRVHVDLKQLAAPVTVQVQRLRATSEKLLREHGEDVIYCQWHQKRLAHAAMDIYAQVATLSRVTAIFDDQGADASGQERYIADTFCSRAAGRVSSALDQVDDNDDDRMHSIARLAYNRGEYGHRLFG
ncbi:MAG: hypothetical protein ACRD1T_09595, partial [Acidimicrobiia bacterium]